MKAPIVRS